MFLLACCDFWEELQFVKALDLGDGKDRFLYDTFAVSEDEKRIFAYAAKINEWRVFSIPESPKEPE